MNSDKGYIWKFATVSVGPTAHLTLQPNGGEIQIATLLDNSGGNGVTIHATNGGKVLIATHQITSLI